MGDHQEGREVPAGLIGTYYSARATYGQYNSFALTSRLHTTLARPHFILALQHALRQNTLRHQNLCHSITTLSSESTAFFNLLPYIHLTDILDIHDVSGDEDEDCAYRHLIGRAHEHRWTEFHCTPGWKVMALRHVSGKVDVIFLGHHALADGMSSVAFQRSLLGYLILACKLSLQELTSYANSEWPIQVSRSTGVPLKIEDFVPHSDTTTPLQVPKDFDPWTAAPPSLSSYTSCAYHVTVPQSHLISGALFRTTHTISQTGFLHYLILKYLSRALPKANGFKSATPYSLRQFSGVGPDEMVCHISCVDSDWDAVLINAIRDFRPAQSLTALQQVNAHFRRDLKAELSRVITEGPPMLNGIKAITNLNAHCTADMRVPARGYTYELSNLGVVAMPGSRTTDSETQLEKLLFTQCGMVTGPALGCNFVAVDGGDMVFSVTWQEGVLEEKIATGLGDFVREAFADAHENENRLMK